MKYKQKVYYQDETKDEIIDFKIKAIKIDENYKYIHKNIFYKLWSFITYRLIATPIDFVYTKLFRRIKFVNRKVLKKHKKGGYFIYANHTDQFSDGFSPTLICFPKKPHLVVNPDNVSMPVWGRFTRMWGALPLPDTLGAVKNFNHAMEHTLEKDNPILIYPEAHLWPYYTKIRPFDARSFRYPIHFDKPVYTFTTTYQLRKEGKKPKMMIYVDGPFYVDKNLDKKQAQQDLRDRIYQQMCERAKLSNYEYLTYIKVDKPVVTGTENTK